MPKERLQPAENGDEAPEGDGEEAGPGKDRPKVRKSHGERALASLRSAKRGMKEVEASPDARAQQLLAEANVLALLDVADALRGPSEED